MKKVLHPANERGYNDIGWLKANFSFSFAGYYDPEKVHFGALRVLNDDYIAPAMGFGLHPHDNMEIITIVSKGALEHKDSMGNVGIIKAGEVQIMSAGTGIRHSEYNPSKTEETNSFQIWIFPKEENITPRYDQKSFTGAMVQNEFTTLIDAQKSEDTLWINQDARLTMGKFDAGKAVDYKIQYPGNGAYVFIIDGSVEIDAKTLNTRDAIGIYDTESFTITTQTEATILIIEVPMF
ncbi:pirin family protein [Mucilaginibacter sp. AW1-3]